MNKFAISAIAATAAVMTLPAYAQAPAMPPATPMVLQQSQIATLWRASKLDDVNVYNTANEKVGEIDDVLIDKTGKAMAVVIDVGGFLGMGEHRVALKFADVTFSDTPRIKAAASATGSTMNAATKAKMYPDHAVLNMTKDQLKALPQVSYSH
jgi:sporulation protein YlmC with PRC-barrel domain